jgi:hypothetical protein
MLQISLALILTLIPLAGAAQAPNAITRESTATATVDRIERSSRVVTFRGEGNVLQTVYVEPAIAAFDDLRVGDVVTIRYTESVIVQVRPNAKPTDLQDTTEQARKAGDASVFQQFKRVVTIESIDPQRLFVTYRTQDDQQIVHAVQDKKLLDGIRTGDRVEITLTRARALSIERKR